MYATIIHKVTQKNQDIFICFITFPKNRCLWQRFSDQIFSSSQAFISSLPDSVMGKVFSPSISLFS